MPNYIQNYNEYLQTPHWEEMRRLKLLHRPYCQVCKSRRQLNIHHKKYFIKTGEDILYKEKVTDLITLCASCHKLMHVYLFGNRKINKLACRVRRLMELGILKNKAFWIAGTYGMWDSLYPEILRKKGLKVTYKNFNYYSKSWEKTAIGEQ